MGDLLISLPCFRYIKTLHPNDEITVLTNKPVMGKASQIEELFQNENLFTSVIKYNLGTRNIIKLIKLCFDLRKKKFDYLYFILAERGRVANIRDFVFFKLSGIKKIVGLKIKYRKKNKQINYKTVCIEPESERLLKNIGASNRVDLKNNFWWNLHLSETEIEVAKKIIEDMSILEKFITICPGTKQDIKDWSIENWISLVKKLNEYKNEYSIVLIGSADEFERCEILLSQWNGKGVNCAGMITPRISAAIIKQARLYIGHDSGPMHLAAAVNTPILAIFSSRNIPYEWYPFGGKNIVLYNRVECLGCYLEKCSKYKNKCILSISPLEVFSCIKYQLNK